MHARILAAAALVSLIGCSGSSTSAPSVSRAPTTASSAGATTSGTTPGVTSAPPASGAPPTFGTRRCWPIVLVHGQPGFVTLYGIEYFYDVPRVLRAAGFEVFVPQLHGAHNADRGTDLAGQILATYPDPRTKVNVIAHSDGGMDARYAISSAGLGAKVASLTVLGAPNQGCTVNDIACALLPNNLPGWLSALVSAGGFDPTAEDTTSYVKGTFNPANPDDPRVAYFSYAGLADPTGSTGCVVDPLFLASWFVLDATEGASDGLVSVESAKWGTFMGTLPADHLNLVGQPLGLTGKFDHRTFYEQWCEELERRGFGP